MQASVKMADDLRQRVLKVSLDLIAREGLEAFSMREVARRASVSHQAPYYHFADREAILAALVADGFRLLRASTEDAMHGLSDPIGRLTAMGRAYINFALTHRAHFKLMFRSELVRSEKHPEAKACAQSAFDFLVATVGEVAAAKGRSDSDALALAAWSTVHGFATLALEGKLDEHCGASKAAHLKAADAVLGTFQRLARAW